MTISSDATTDTAPVRRSRWWLESLLLLWLAWVYDLINGLTPLRRVVPYQHAKSVLHLERVLHLDPETYLNRWMVTHHAIAWMSATFYNTAHYIVTFTLLAVLWWRRPDVYRPLRTALALTNVIGLIVFLCYPMAPPRLTPGGGFVDIVVTSHTVTWHTGTLEAAANELAAMPSLHISWAIWSALAFRAMFKRYRWSYLAWLHPIVTTIAVLGTGNHFFADVIAGALVLVVASIASKLWYRYEPLARVPRPAWYLKMEHKRLTRAAGRARRAPEPAGASRP